MKLTQIIKLCAMVILPLSLVSCGPAVRTADGNCYYRGKGILQLGAVFLDSTAAWADATLEAEYQRNQIALQKLSSKLNAIDPNTLQTNEEIYSYNRDVEEERRLTDSVNRYQEKKRRELESGPSESFSKMVDESGKCR